MSNLDDLGAESRRLYAEAWAKQRRSADLSDRLRAAVSPDVWGLVREHSDAKGEMLSAWADFHLAELCRHFPGPAPAPFRVWEHILEDVNDERAVGACCLADPDGSP